MALHLEYQDMKSHAHLTILSICISYFDNADSFKMNDEKLKSHFDDKKLKTEN